MFYIAAIVQLILLLVIAPSISQGDQPLVQADVYNTLYEAYVRCDDDFDQTRSEFITDRLVRSSGEISIESLKKILNHNVQIAKQSIAQKTRERDVYISEILEAHDNSSDQPVDSDGEDKAPYKEVRQIDRFLKEKKRYVEVHECVLEIL